MRRATFLCRTKKLEVAIRRGYWANSQIQVIREQRFEMEMVDKSDEHSMMNDNILLLRSCPLGASLACMTYLIVKAVFHVRYCAVPCEGQVGTPIYLLVSLSSCIALCMLLKDSRLDHSRLRGMSAIVP